MSVAMLSKLLGRDVVVQAGTLQVPVTVSDITVAHDGKPVLTVIPHGHPGGTGVINGFDLLFDFQGGDAEVDKAIDLLQRAGAR